MSDRQLSARWGVITAFAVVGVYLVEVVVAATASGDLADHAAGAGRIVEGLAGTAFLLGAVALLLLAPIAALGWWAAGIAGLAASGVTMLWVVATAIEPPIWVFYAEVTLATVGLVLITASSIRRRVLPWWAAVGLSLLLPIMFLLPLNAVFMGLVWVCVGVGALRTSRRPAPVEAASALAMLPS